MRSRPLLGRWMWRVAVLGPALALLACPIQRPIIPRAYYGFRSELEAAVRDTAMAILAGRPAVQERLDRRIVELAAIAVVDSLVASLYADDLLRELGGAVDARVRAALQAEGVSGDVRKAYRHPHGQRLACDAIIVGLGRALHLTRTGVAAPH